MNYFATVTKLNFSTVTKLKDVKQKMKQKIAYVAKRLADEKRPKLSVVIDASEEKTVADASYVKRVVGAIENFDTKPEQAKKQELLNLFESKQIEVRFPLFSPIPVLTPPLPHKRAAKQTALLQGPKSVLAPKQKKITVEQQDFKEENKVTKNCAPQKPTTSRVPSPSTPPPRSKPHVPPRPNVPANLVCAAPPAIPPKPVTVKPPAVPTPATHISVRASTLRDLLKSEFDYSRILSATQSYWVNPVTQCTEDFNLAPYDAKLLFRNWKDIAELHSNFNAKLQSRAKDETDFLVGDILCELMNSAKEVYHTYVSQHKRATSVHLNIQGHRAFLMQSIRNQTNPDFGHLDLGSCLIMPVQRLPRYILFLEKLKACSEGHQDLPKICTALGMCRSMIGEIEDTIARDNTLHPGLLMKGNLHKVCRHSQRRYLFMLFPDRIIYYNSFGIERTIPLDENCVITRLESEDNQHRWKIESTVKSFVVFTDNVTDGKLWAPHFEKYANDIDRSSRIAVTYVQSKHVRSCLVCEKAFNPLLRMRHHCHNCGEVVCDGCSANRMVLSNSNGAVRICKPCFDLKEATKRQDKIMEMLAEIHEQRKQGDQGEGKCEGEGEDGVIEFSEAA